MRPLDNDARRHRQSTEPRAPGGTELLCIFAAGQRDAACLFRKWSEYLLLVGADRVGINPGGSTSGSRGRLPMNNSRDHAWSWWYLLLLLQFVPALWVPFYNSVEPSFVGMPFFYWFQLALVFISAAVTAVVYWATE